MSNALNAARQALRTHRPFSISCAAARLVNSLNVFFADALLRNALRFRRALNARNPKMGFALRRVATRPCAVTGRRSSPALYICTHRRRVLRSVYLREWRRAAPPSDARPPRAQTASRGLCQTRLRRRSSSHAWPGLRPVLPSLPQQFRAPPLRRKPLALPALKGKSPQRHA